MILPGHLAAPTLASRFLDIDRRVALLAGVAPDLVDKFAFYILHVTRCTRIPAHALSGLAVTALGAALLGRLWRRDWRWGVAWLAGYALHLLCDILPAEGPLPWLWPFRPYSSMISSGRPWFLGGGPVPWLAVIAEIGLVVAAVAVEWAHRARSDEGDEGTGD